MVVPAAAHASIAATSSFGGGVIEGLSAGKLVIVNDNGVFELVPPAIAEKIRARNPSLVIDLPSDEEPSADDPYADYQVPDDLIW